MTLFMTFSTLLLFSQEVLEMETGMGTCFQLDYSTMDITAEDLMSSAGLTPELLASEVQQYCDSGLYEKVVLVQDDMNYFTIDDSWMAHMTKKAQKYLGCAGFQYATVYRLDRTSYDADFRDLVGMDFDEWVKAGTACVASDMTLFFEGEYRNSTKTLHVFPDTVDFVATEVGETTKSLHINKVIPSAKMPKIWQGHGSTELLVFLPCTENSSYTTLCLKPIEEQYAAGLELVNTHSAEQMQANDKLYIAVTDDYADASVERKLLEFMSVIVFYVLALVLFVNVFNIMNTVHTSILNRRRELAMLRAVGMTQWQSRCSVLAEALSYVVTALALSLVLSTVFVWGVLFASGMESVLWQVTLLRQTMVTLLVAGGFAVVAAIPAIRSFERQPVMETIREIE